MAPRRIASTATATSVTTEIMMTPMSVCFSRTCLSTSRPFIPGICTSRSITSTALPWSVCSASSPEATVMGNMPALRTMASIVCRMLRSSSAMRTVAALPMGACNLPRARLGTQAGSARSASHQPDGQQNEEHRPRDERLEERRLEAPDEVEDGQDAGEIRQPVERLPAPEAEPLHPAFRRSHCERQQAAPGGEPHGHEPALDDVLADRREVEPLVDGHVGGEMERGVEEREEAQHAADAQRPFPSEDELHRRASQRAEKEDQGVEAEPVQHLGDRIGSQRSAHRPAREPEQRRSRAEEDDRLEQQIAPGPQ